LFRSRRRLTTFRWMTIARPILRGVTVNLEVFTLLTHDAFSGIGFRIPYRWVLGLKPSSGSAFLHEALENYDPWSDKMVSGFAISGK
jgi:hypothetical protein